MVGLPFTENAVLQNIIDDIYNLIKKVLKSAL